MRPKIQIQHVTNHVKHLEEQIQIIEPVIEAMKIVVEKSKTWIEDQNSLPSLTYIELQEELDSASTSLLNVSAEMLKQNNEDIDEHEQPQDQSTQHTIIQLAAAESKGQFGKLADIASSLQLIEKALSSLQDAKQKTEDDISEIKQWRNSFIAEQTDNNISFENFSRKQKQNFKNFRKIINEQDDKVMELNKSIEKLKEKESKSNKTLEKLSLDMKEYETNAHKINKDFKMQTDKIDDIRQEIKRHADFISVLQVDAKNHLIDTRQKFVDLLAKNNVMYKILQQRLMPLDKMIRIFNREGNTRKLENLEKYIVELSHELYAAETRMYKRYVCQMQLASITIVRSTSIISTFNEVREYNGQNFNQTTGIFNSPHDGLYLICVTLHVWENKQIGVGVMSDNRCCMYIEIKCAGNSAAGSVVVDMKKGQELYFQLDHTDRDAKLSCYSSFTIVSL
ncbi:cytadherence high molecular weight protein 2-like [Physella acuta]|uniref:cytadherence high molecular weight protein 2-like n=1 Tax=Physella acuta TaxID=109671 RepID=UPI0027DBF6D7|nr:cytadherence high molecular weight protein 2-like [Physella acuta]